MTETTQPLHTWQFFACCRRILGDAFLQKLFQRALRQMQRWSADPDFADSTERNPLDRYELLLSRLMERGREDIARAAVARQAYIVGCELQGLNPAEPNKSVMSEECLDDLPVLAEYHRLLNDAGSSPEAVRVAWQNAKRELDENYELFVRKAEGK